MTGIEELTWDQLQAEGFAGVVPGGVVLSNQVAGALGRGILLAESLQNDGPAEWSHAMTYSGGGRCISQGWRIREISLRDYTGAYLKAFTPPYPPERRQALVSQMRRHLGRPYDVPGILGQLLTSLTGNAWFARAVETPWLTYCSELVCSEIRRHLDPDYLLGHRTCQVTPDAMDLWMTAAGWESRTIRLKG
jgi:hypothetical protein